MNDPNRYKAFVRRYLTRGAVGVSVGLSAVASASAAPHPELGSDNEPTVRSFANRLSTVRSAVSENIKEDDTRLAQGALPLPHLPPPPPPPPVRAFENFGKQAFADAWKNFGKTP